jgi:hypothetical protein
MNCLHCEREYGLPCRFSCVMGAAFHGVQRLFGASGTWQAAQKIASPHPLAFGRFADYDLKVQPVQEDYLVRHGSYVNGLADGRLGAGLNVGSEDSGQQ